MPDFPNVNVLVPQDIEYVLIDDIQIVQGEEFHFLLCCETPPGAELPIAKKVMMMTPENFRRCLQNKVTIYGKPPR